MRPLAAPPKVVRESAPERRPLRSSADPPLSVAPKGRLKGHRYGRARHNYRQTPGAAPHPATRPVETNHRCAMAKPTENHPTKPSPPDPTHRFVCEDTTPDNTMAIMQRKTLMLAGVIEGCGVCVCV